MAGRPRLGIRCSNKDYSYVVLAGPRDAPEMLEKGGAAVPAGYGRSEVVHWMVQEVGAILDRLHPQIVSMRASESMSAKTTLLERIELETAVYAAAGARGLKAVFKKRRATIAKNLGLKGRAKALDEDLDTSVLKGYDGLPDKAKEAALAAWSDL